MRNLHQQLDADLERARGRMYGFFAAVLLNRPGPRMLAGLLSEQAMVSLQLIFPGHPAARRLARLAADGRRGRDGEESFLLDYEALFRAPGGAYTCPYESAYPAAGDGRRGAGESLMDVGRARLAAAAYQKMGLAPRDDFDESPDHIGVQFDFMAWLCRSTAEALAKGDVQKALRLKDRQETFLEEHLLAWASECLAKIEDRAATDLYQGLAGLGKAFLALERRGAPH